MGSSRVGAAVHRALEALPLGPLSVRGNDGLTRAERAEDVARFRAGVGSRVVEGEDHALWLAEVRATAAPLRRYSL